MTADISNSPMASSSLGASSGQLPWIMRNLPKRSLSSQSLIILSLVLTSILSPKLENVFNFSFSVGSQTDTVGVDRSLSLIKSSKRFWPFSAKWSMSSFALFWTRAEDTRLFSGDEIEKGFSLQCVSIRSFMAFSLVWQKLRLKVCSAQSIHIVLKFVESCSDTALQYERGEVLL